MSSTSKIEWTDATWNPIVGCSVVSPGCTNCYAMKMAGRIEKMNPTGGSGTAYVNHYDGTTKSSKAGAVWTGKVARAPDKILLQPLSWKRPRRVFVNSMGDLFHESIPDEWIDRVFAVMALAPRHTFQVLTKRAGRMRRYLTNADQNEAMRQGIRSGGFTVVQRVHALCADFIRDGKFQVDGFGPVYREDWERAKPRLRPLPLPNVWLGISAEDQPRADERVPDLLQTPAAVRFVSCEPLLGPITLAPKADSTYRRLSQWYGPDGFDPAGSQPQVERREGLFPKIDWLICGGESGKNARPMHPQWARDLRDQCVAADVPFFFKQWGEWAPRVGAVDGWAIDDNPEISRFDHREWKDDHWSEPFRPMWCDWTDGNYDEDHCVSRIGKKAAGRLLDGVQHSGFPEVRS